MRWLLLLPLLTACADKGNCDFKTLYGTCVYSTIPSLTEDRMSFAQYMYAKNFPDLYYHENLTTKEIQKIFSYTTLEVLPYDFECPEYVHKYCSGKQLDTRLTIVYKWKLSLSPLYHEFHHLIDLEINGTYMTHIYKKPPGIEVFVDKEWEATIDMLNKQLNYQGD